MPSLGRTPWYRRKCSGPYRIASLALAIIGGALAVLGNASVAGLGLLLLGVGGVVCLIGALRAKDA